MRILLGDCLIDAPVVLVPLAALILCICVQAGAVSLPVPPPSKPMHDAAISWLTTNRMRTIGMAVLQQA